MPMTLTSPFCLVIVLLFHKKRLAIAHFFTLFLFQSKTIENIDLRISTSACNIAVVASSILTSKVNAANMALSIPLFMGQ